MLSIQQIVSWQNSTFCLRICVSPSTSVTALMICTHSHSSYSNILILGLQSLICTCSGGMQPSIWSRSSCSLVVIGFKRKYPVHSNSNEQSHRLSSLDMVGCDVRSVRSLVIDSDVGFELPRSGVHGTSVNISAYWRKTL